MVLLKLKKYYKKCIYSLFVFYSLLLFAEGSYDLDLEGDIQDFVLETKRVMIPESPYAFNPSIIRWNGQLLMSYREVSSALKEVDSASNSYISIIRLDEKFNQVGNSIRIAFRKEGELSRIEDARLIEINGELVIIYSDNVDEEVRESGYRVYVAKLRDTGNNFEVICRECLSEFEGRDDSKREKNWVPFQYEGNLLLAYGLSPHKILLPLLDGSKKAMSFCTSRPSIVWEWGELRGGTPGLKLNDHDYLSFFHSSKMLSSFHSEGSLSLHYFIGAYVFSALPPFEILQISPEPIIGKNFYHGLKYEPYWKPVNAVFPCGFIYDGDYIWVSYGRQDHEVWLVKIDKKGLLESLIQVSTNR